MLFHIWVQMFQLYVSDKLMITLRLVITKLTEFNSSFS
jgi:hypothetical protein